MLNICLHNMKLLILLSLIAFNCDADRKNKRVDLEKKSKKWFQKEEKKKTSLAERRKIKGSLKNRKQKGNILFVSLGVESQRII